MINIELKKSFVGGGKLGEIHLPKINFVNLTLESEMALFGSVEYDSQTGERQAEGYLDEEACLLYNEHSKRRCLDLVKPGVVIVTQNLYAINVVLTNKET